MTIKKTFIILTSHFPPSKGGGIQEWAYGIAKHLALKNYIVKVFSRRKDNQLLIHQNEKFSVFRMKGRNWHQFHFIYSLYYLLKILFNNPSCTIIATTWFLSKPYVYLKKIFPKSKMIIVCHGLEVTSLKKKKIKSFQNIVKISNLVICVSNFTKNAVFNLCHNLKNKNHIKFIPNGIDPKKFSSKKMNGSILNEYNIDSKSIVITTLSRLIRRKGHDLVIKSIKRLIKTYPKIHYVIAGHYKPGNENNYKEELIRLINKLDLNKNVSFIDYVPEKKIVNLYTESDIFIMVSKLLPSGDSEGFGITFLEANVCGCPVIGSRSGGIVDAIEHEVSGLLVEENDLDSICNAINRILIDKSLRENLIFNGKKRVLENYTWSKITNKIINELNRNEKF